MSTLYLQRDTWYLNLSVHNKRIRKSLRTNHLPTANKIAKGQLKDATLELQKQKGFYDDEGNYVE